jgi:hypothetical protein
MWIQNTLVKPFVDCNFVKDTIENGESDCTVVKGLILPG